MNSVDVRTGTDYVLLKGQEIGILNKIFFLLRNPKNIIERLKKFN